MFPGEYNFIKKNYPMQTIQSILLLLIVILSNPVSIRAQYFEAPNYLPDIQKESLGRGLTAVHIGNGEVMVSWRYLESDSLNITFDLLRQSKSGKPIKLNPKPIAKSTCFKDIGLNISQTNTYFLRISNTRQTLAQYTLTPKLAEKPYISIPMQPITGDNEWRYAPNDASVGDLDGDGEYELIIKRENGGFDNSHLGLCHGTTLLEG
jgi:rhamnogalacturonan endolyase